MRVMKSEQVIMAIEWLTTVEAGVKTLWVTYFFKSTLSLFFYEVAAGNI